MGNRPRVADRLPPLVDLVSCQNGNGIGPHANGIGLWLWGELLAGLRDRQVAGVWQDVRKEFIDEFGLEDQID